MISISTTNIISKNLEKNRLQFKFCIPYFMVLRKFYSTTTHHHHHHNHIPLTDLLRKINFCFIFFLRNSHEVAVIVVTVLSLNISVAP